MSINSIKMSLLLCLILIVSMSVVSAQDGSGDVVSVDLDMNNNMVSFIEDNNVYSFSDNDLLQADNTQTFTDLREKINNDLASGNTVTLTSNYTFDESGDTKGPITISKANVIIDGNGFTIDGAGKSAIFSSTASGITFKNIKFVNAYVSGNGAAISSTGAAVNIVDCEFNNCTATTNGGAIYLTTGKNAVVDNCIFTNNSAGSSSYQGGGAIYASSDGGIIKNSQFSENYATGQGGAIRLASYAQQIDNCDFTDNYLTGSSADGGAVYMWAGTSRITNSNFTRNKATSRGGGVFGYGTIESCNFINNTANNGAGVGGSNAALTVKFSNFTNNIAGSLGIGGGFYGYGTIESCNFTNNIAYRGGAVSIYASGTNQLTILKSSFENNTADLTGGAISTYNSQRPLTVDECTFIGNNANSSYGAYGGAIYTYDSSTGNKITNSKFIENKAVNGGGAIYLKGSDSLVENCTFINNTAYRGTIYSQGNNHDYNNLICIDNYATEGSVFYIVGNSKYTIANTLMLNNTAGKYQMKLFTNFNGVDAESVSVFYGQDNLLNAIRVRPDAKVVLRNVTYWGIGGVRNTGLTDVGQVDGEPGQAPNRYYIFNKTEPVIYNDDRESFINTTIVVIYQGDNFLSKSDSVFDDADLWCNDTILNDKDLFQNYVINGRTPFKNMEIFGIYTDATNWYGNISAITKNLIPGQYSVFSFHKPDKYYVWDKSNVNQFGIPPAVITAENITVGDKEVIEVFLPNDISGSVTVGVGNQTYSVNVYQGKGLLVVRDLPAGNYTANITFHGNSKYSPAFNQTNFTVSKLNPNIYVIDQNNGTVAVVVSNATGNVTVNVNGTPYTANLTNGIAYINLNNNTPGNYNITVNYHGDAKYNSGNRNSNINIPKKLTPINVTADSIFVGDTARIIVNVPKNATGNVTIEINGRNFTSKIKDGVAVFNITNLTAGNKTVAVKYSGDDNFIGNTTTGAFNVVKRQSTVNVTVQPANVGDKIRISVEVPNNATGQVLVDIGDQHHYINVTDGKGFVDAVCLTEGNYDINVTYLGDNQYLPSNNTSKVKISKLSSNVTAKVDNITVGENAVINITVPIDATGNVTVTIKDETGNIITKDVPVDNGAGQLIVPNLKPGNYTVDVKYNGNWRFENNSNSTVFTVSKKDMKDLTVIDLGNGTVKVVSLPCDATGNITVNVGNNSYTGEIINGIATIDLDNETAGKHNITVTYPGDDNHNGFDKNDSVIIPKRNTPINVTAKSIYVGEDTQITVEVPKGTTGNITVEIDGKEYTSTIKDGKAEFIVSDLLEGDRTVAVKYPGDDSYVENFTTGQFTVSKRPTTTKVTAKDIVYGNDGVITVHVTKETTGNVLVDVDGTGYYAKVINGVAKVVVPNLKIGTHIVKASYEGDEKFLKSNSSTTIKVKQPKDILKITNDIIPVGKNATVIVSVPKDAKGSVTITVEGKSYTLPVTDGQAIFSIPGLKIGNHTVIAVYSGEDYGEFTVKGWIYVYDDSYPPVNNSTKPHKNLSAKVNEITVTPTNETSGNPILALLLALVILPLRRKL